MQPLCGRLCRENGIASRYPKKGIVSILRQDRCFQFPPEENESWTGASLSALPNLALAFDSGIIYYKQAKISKQP